jgi:hypothetical protein
VSGPALTWLVIGLVSSVAMIAILVALVRHVLVLGRALARFQQEVSTVASEVTSEGARAGSRSRGISARSPGRSPGQARIHISEPTTP